MRKFYSPIDKRSRQAMTGYLKGHFRYNTMNAWNRSTSYACNMKIHNLGLDHEITLKLFEMMQTDTFFEPFQDLMQHFAMAYDYKWQVGMNGRSGGYLVLYQGGREPSAYKSYCTTCRQRNFLSVAQNGTQCGTYGNHARVDFAVIPMQATTYPGRSTDMDEDFVDWSMCQLRDRVELVQSLDQLADAMVDEALYMARNFEVSEETFLVEQKRTIIVPVA